MKRGLLFILAILIFSLPQISAIILMVPLPDKTLSVGNTWYLSGNESTGVYSLYIDSVTSSQVVIKLIKDSRLLDTKQINSGDLYQYTAGDIVVRANVASINGNTVSLTTNSISEAAVGSTTRPNQILIQSSSHTINVGEFWDIPMGGGYRLKLESINETSSPNRVYLALSKDCKLMSNYIATVPGGYYMTFNDGTPIVAKVYFDRAYTGLATDIVSLKNLFIDTNFDVYDPSRTIITENWQCGSWSACSNGVQTRECNDLNHCNIYSNPVPQMTQNCTVASQGCVESWECTEWTDCITNKLTRTCTDSNACGTTLNKPNVLLNCDPNSNRQNCAEKWQCSNWSLCSSGIKERTCSDGNNCGTIINKPTLRMNCNSTIIPAPGQLNQSIQIVVLKIGNDPVKSDLQIFSNSSKFYVNLSTGVKEIKILPELILVLSGMDKIDNISIVERNGKGLYLINGYVKARLFFIFEVLVKVEKMIDVETGKTIYVKKPWWSFLASGF